MIRLLTAICIFGTIQALEVIPERPEIEYTNPKYVKNLKFVIQRKGRGSPYYIHLIVETLTGCGNNMTISMQLFEIVGGNYLPTGVQGDFKTCAFLEHEPYLGKMFMNQLKQLNLTCPFSAGSYEIKDLVIHLEKFPFHIPFIWSPISVKTMTNISGLITGTNELIFNYKFFMTVNQKPRNKKV